MKLISIMIISAVFGIGVGLVHAKWVNTGIQEQFRPVSMDVVAEMMGIELIEEQRDENSPIATVVGGYEYDFGIMERRGTRSHTFVIRNDGVQNLTLKKGETTCKCTFSSLEQGTVAPGESVEIKLEWTAKEIGPTNQFDQSAEIYTNDPGKRLIRLVVRGEIIQSVLPKPEVLTMNNISSGESYTATTRIFCYKETQEDLAILDYELLGAEPLDLIEVEFEAMSAAEVEQELHATSGQLMHVKLKSGLRPGAFNQVIRLKTNLPDAPRADVFVNGEVVNDITVFGRGFRASSSENDDHFGVLNLGTIESKKGLQHSIVLVVKGVHRKDVQFKVQMLDPVGILAVDIEEAKVVGSGKTVHHKLNLEVKQGSPAVSRIGGTQGMPGRILLTTTHPVVKEISIQVVFTIVP